MDKTMKLQFIPAANDLTNTHSWRKVCALEPASNAIVRWMDGKQLLAITTPESAYVLSVFFN
jgi:hypothetical protein